MSVAGDGTLAMGVDIGGTELRIALLDAAGRVAAEDRRSTDAGGGPSAVIAQIEAMSAGLAPKQMVDVAGVGVGVPGPVDAERGLVHVAPALRGWVDVPFAALLQERLGLPVQIENDAHVAALGEWRWGAGRGLRHLVYVTVSTGIGGGVIVDGALFGGAGGLATQFGHMIVAERSPPCFCGAIGCWEALASGSAIGWLASEAVVTQPESRLATITGGGPITARHVFDAAESGDALARSLVDREAAYLARGLINLLHLFSPEMIVMGGGVSNRLPAMIDGITAAIRHRALPPYRDVPVVAAALGDRSGVIGAASLVNLSQPFA